MRQTDSTAILQADDSISIALAEQSAQFCESLYAGNEPANGFIWQKERPIHGTSGWIFGALIILLALISLYLNNQKFKIKDIFMSLFDMRALDRVFRENNLRPRSLMPMTGIYLASLSILAVYTLQHNESLSFATKDWTTCLTILGALIVYIFVKNYLIRFFCTLFDDNNASFLYISNSYLFYFVGGLVTIPVLLLLFYSPIASSTIFNILLIFIATTFILRIIRGMQLILTNSKSSKLYLFYYLCIFEIVPILVVLKTIIS
ncbi:MAG: DUF4271 domain-containing protein [Bacteroidales bacterium]|nr:DUF4271 domain-containing protein [Bacteroidales bacterium]